MIIKNLSDSSVVSSGFKFYYEIQNKIVSNTTCPPGYIGDNCDIGIYNRIIYEILKWIQKNIKISFQ